MDENIRLTLYASHHLNTHPGFLKKKFRERAFIFNCLSQKKFTHWDKNIVCYLINHPVKSVSMMWRSYYNVHINYDFNNDIYNDNFV